MKVRYDEEMDAAYIQFSSKRPKGAIESKQGIVLHVANKRELVGIEILDASERFPIRSLHTLQFLS